MQKASVAGTLSWGRTRKCPLAESSEGEEEGGESRSGFSNGSGVGERKEGEGKNLKKEKKLEHYSTGRLLSRNCIELLCSPTLGGGSRDEVETRTSERSQRLLSRPGTGMFFGSAENGETRKIEFEEDWCKKQKNTRGKGKKGKKGLDHFKPKGQIVLYSFQEEASVGDVKKMARLEEGKKVT